MVSRWLHLARGQVRLRVTGASLTRFLNVCASHELTLRRMRRTAWNELTCFMSVEDFRALRRFMGRTGCRVHIAQKAGVPFLAARLRPRTVLWGGFVLFAALCWLMITRVWAIEPHIDPALPRAAVMEALEREGVRIGASKGMNVKQIRWRVMQQVPELSFLSLNISGNRLTIEATGSVMKPEMLDEDAVVKVVATRDGVVEQMNVWQGAPLVRPGDAVAVGDTLVSGLVPPTTETGDYHLTHARGEIMAHTTYDVDTRRALQTEKKTYTGKVKKQYALVFGSHRLNLYFGSGIAGGSCDKIIETKTAWLSDSVVFPVSLVRQTYVYYERQPEAAAAEDAAADMAARVLARLEAGMQGTITGERQSFDERDGAVTLHLQAQAIEQIGAEALDDSVIPETPPAPSEDAP